MSLKYVAVLLVASMVNAGTIVAERSFHGVDPNTLSCDPSGQVFLLLPSYTDCNAFYMCTHGQEVQFRCSSPELIFDFAQQTCAWPFSGTCILRSRDDSEEEGSGDEPGAFEDPSVSIDRTIIDCTTAETASKQIAYRDDCQRYWRCMSGLPQTAYCSDGLFFNPQSQQCDYEANVKCELDHEEELQGEYIVYK